MCISISLSAQMSGKRSRSFKCAVHHRDREVCSENDFHIFLEPSPIFRRMVTVIAMEVLPEERDRKYYADNYSCCPPPLFIILITLVEVSSVLWVCVCFFGCKIRWAFRDENGLDCHGNAERIV